MTDALTDIERFRAIVERGGKVTCAPDVYELFAEHFATTGFEVTVSTRLPAGWIVAMDQPPVDLMKVRGFSLETSKL